MHAVSLAPPLAVMFTAAVIRWVVWSGLVLLTVALLILMRTRWGQSHPLRKCVVLSIVAHLLLAIYTTTVNIVTASIAPTAPQEFRVTIDDAPPGDGSGGEVRDDEPWNTSDWPSTDDKNATSDDATEPDRASMTESTLPAPQGSQPDNVARTERDSADVHEPPLEPIGNESPTPVAPKEPEPAAVSVRPRQDPLEDLIHPTSPADVPPPIETAPHPAPTETAGDPIERVDPPAGPDQASEQLNPEESPLTDLASNPVDNSSAGSANGNESLPRDPGSTSKAGEPRAGQASPAAVDSSFGGNPKGRAPKNVEVSTSANGTGPARGPRAGSDASGQWQPPAIYDGRFAADRAKLVAGHGGNTKTEASVAAALKWLAANQSPNGRFDARRLGGGREVMVNGQDRGGAGAQADAGITGLVLLTFLAAGHTHVHGTHADTVRHGLEYLLSIQAADGNLAGNATLYEKMYCHAMATFALSEAYAMTGDARLQAAVRKAITFTVATQNRPTGGWRYHPAEPGDTSQLGWQFMALKSADLAGVSIPDDTRQGIIRFLKSVALGEHGGLACYRPGHPASRAMTAEALVCRQFLGMTRENPASDEAGQYLLQEVPGQGESNFYYWYYATLGMYQLQGPAWQRWNEALQSTLLGSQRTDGELAGSWDPDEVWGAYGGRAYSTALGGLCLEVYYRFLPVYVEAASRDRAPK